MSCDMFWIGDQYCQIFYVIKFHIKWCLYILLFFILPFKGKLSPRCESTSCIQNNNGKRTFLTSNDDITYDNDIYCK